MKLVLDTPRSSTQTQRWFIFSRGMEQEIRDKPEDRGLRKRKREQGGGIKEYFLCVGGGRWVGMGVQRAASG